MRPEADPPLSDENGPTPQGTVYTVRALDRALGLLDVFSVERPRMTLAELAKTTHLPKPTVFRLASTLVGRGYLERVGGQYEVGLRCFQLGSIFRASIDIRARALPHLIELRDTTGETVQLAVLSGDHIVYIERVFSLRPVAYMRSTVGAVLPAYCTGLGKAMLAHQTPEDLAHYLAAARLERQTPNTITNPHDLLEELRWTRQRGYAFDNEEREVGVRCIAAPIFDVVGRCVAALSVAAPVGRLPLPLEGSPVLRSVVGAAAAVSYALGSRHATATATRER